MASFHESVNVLEECRVFPPPGAVGEKSFPLTFFDLLWLDALPVQTLYFYKFPHSKTRFIETIIPSLKLSLSLSLEHYYPLAGNLLSPPNLEEPEIRCEDGDSVSLTFAESDSDFDYLVKNHPREVAHFHSLVPQLPSVSTQLGTVIAPLLAVQVTLFPNSGISFGFALNHVVADGSAFVRFIKLWATFHKSEGEPMVLESAILPFYDRSTMLKELNTGGSIDWQRRQNIKFEAYRQLLPTSNILATFVLSEAYLQSLKKRVKVQCPTLSHVSSFVVTCAYTWVCIVKARASSGEEVSENELEHFGFAIDCRGHLEPPLPENYFGNCIALCHVATKNSQLMEEDGFIYASNLIGEATGARLGSKKGVSVGSETPLPDISSKSLARAVGVAGSPRLAVYDIDFGFGKLQKREIISIDQTRSISLHEGKHNKLDIEVGLSFPKIKMEAFASIFTHGLMVDDH